MKKLIKTLSVVSFTLSSMAGLAQNSSHALLESLQLEESTPVMELNVGQLIQILNFTPTANPVCADFSGEMLGNSYLNNHIMYINGLSFHIEYTGGARVSNWDGYGSALFLEMVEDGKITISLPTGVTASHLSLKIIQGANLPIYIEYFNNGSLVGSNTSTVKDVVEQIDLNETAVDSVVLHHHELLISEVCYQ